MLRAEPFPGMKARGLCSCELDAPDTADCAGKRASPLDSSLLALLLPASLELWECRTFAGETCEGASGDDVRGITGDCAADDRGSSARRFDDDGLVFFWSRFGWLGDRLGGCDPGRACSRKDCAEAAALRLILERPACCTWRSSFAST